MSVFHDGSALDDLARVELLSLDDENDFLFSRPFMALVSSPSLAVLHLTTYLLMAPWSAGGGDREDVALSYVYADSGCVAASWLCVL